MNNTNPHANKWYSWIFMASDNPEQYLSVLCSVALFSVPLLLTLKWYYIQEFLAYNPLAFKSMSLMDYLFGLIYLATYNPIAVLTANGPLLLSSVHWTTWSQLLGFSSEMLMMTPVFIIIFGLRRIAIDCYNGNYFLADSTTQYASNHSSYFHAAVNIIALQIFLAALSSGILAYAATFGSSGEHYFIYGAGSSLFPLLIIVATTMKVIANMIDRAVAIKSEQDSTI